MTGNSTIFTVAIILVIIGAINWGLYGLFNNNLLNSLNKATVNWNWLERLIYILVGVAGLYLLYHYWIAK